VLQYVAVCCSMLQCVDPHTPFHSVQGVRRGFVLEPCHWVLSYLLPKSRALACTLKSPVLLGVFRDMIERLFVYERTLYFKVCLMI